MKTKLGIEIWNDFIKINAYLIKKISSQIFVGFKICMMSLQVIIKKSLFIL